MSKAQDISDLPALVRRSTESIQVNLGGLCNQACLHCHIDAGPDNRKIMGRGVMDEIIEVLKSRPRKTLDITGGAPELNPDFDYLVNSCRPLVEKIIVRCNLTVLFEPGKDYLPDFYKENRVELTCSLPCYLEENVDRQRGRGVYQKSVKALKLLNGIGYGREKSGLILNLLYNPGGPYLPGNQGELEKAYKRELKNRFGIEFNRLYCLTNMPISRFKRELVRTGAYDSYMALLKENYNPATEENLMCLDQISVGYDGAVYDCDFNQMLGLRLVKEGRPLSVSQISRWEPDYIMVKEHCFGCMAGSGSSCTGSLS
ncbi:MAG: arsenosugar biosynthesis radical SAM (seleno)protein ArsS [bacterium]